MSTTEIASHLALAAAAFPFLGITEPGQLLETLELELGGARLLDSWQAYGEGRLRAAAPDTILHILSGNTPAAGLQSLIRGLLIGTRLNRCKLPSDGLPEIGAFLDLLPRELAKRVEISEDLLPGWLTSSEVIVVFGSDDTIAQLRQRAPATARFLAYGHKVSVGLIFDGANEEVARAAARDVALFDQQGCLSPHVFFVRHRARSFAAALAAGLEEEEQSCPRAPLSVSEHSAIRNAREEFLFRISTGEEGQIWQSQPGTEWTVIYHADPVFTASCLNRLVYVKPFPADLGTWRIPHLSTAGIWPVTEPNAEIAARIGATRVCPIGRMQNPAFRWHQDGMPAIGSLVRWIDLET